MQNQLLFDTQMKTALNTHKYGHGETRNKKLIKRRNDITQGWSSAGFNIALEKGREKKGKKKQIITTRGIRIWSPIQAVAPPSRAYFVEQAKHVPCGIVTLRRTRFLKLLRCEKASKREKTSETGWQSREGKLEKYENEYYYFLWWSDMGFFPRSLGQR